MKKLIKGGLAALLSILLIVPDVLPAKAQENSETPADEVIYNTGSGDIRVTVPDVSGNDAGEAFAADGSYTIQTELNAFFPYEVQFQCNGETVKKWFMDPASEVELGGHTFRVETQADGTALTQLSLEVGGDTVVVYPEEKEFPSLTVAPLSLLPIKEVALSEVDLSAYTPAELTQVSVKALLGSNVADGDTVVWKSARYSYVSDEDDYTVSLAGDVIDMSVGTYSSSSFTYELIVGTGDQLDADAVRYRVPVKITESAQWLTAVAYAQDAQGGRTPLKVLNTNSYSTYYLDYRAEDREMRISVSSGGDTAVQEAYVSLAVNTSLFGSAKSLRAYEGKYTSAAEAMAATEITDKIFCADMTQPGAGYLLREYNLTGITIVSFDGSGNVTGCLPLELYLRQVTYCSLHDSYYLQGMTESGYLSSNMVDTYRSSYKDGCNYLTYILYKGYSASDTYYKRFVMEKEGVSSPESVTGAYLGLYNSVAEAAAAGAADIKADLFGSQGYAADYSQGVYMTIIAGADGDPSQKIWKYCIQVEEGTDSKEDSSADSSATSLQSGTAVNFYQFKTADGSTIPCYRVSYTDDSYGEFNYLTILVDKDVTDEQLANLAPTFRLATGVTLYAAGSNAPEVSGQSFHDFTQPVQYTASAEDGENSKNYWVSVVRATDGAGKLYINSLTDYNAHTEERDGVIYSTREVMLDSYHSDKHDILLVNTGTAPIAKLSAELVSDTVELDSYWTLKGTEDLPGFVDTTGYQPQAADGTQEEADYGELWNLAKVRLTVKEGVAAGTDISGTLTIKSEGKPLMVLELTGTIGDPVILTKEIPQAVKYVPYGTMIQNSNKYSLNKVSYELYWGDLPEGMIIKPNGEIYGVPREAGQFNFTVRMSNSFSSFDSCYQSYTMTVVDNTDANVDSATDAGYELSERIPTVVGFGDNSNYTLRSLGGLAEFQEIYLDGVKLVKDQDYTATEGSTVITISSQTLKVSNVAGTHTLGMEFRTSGDILKRAAQNYSLGESTEGGSTGGNDSADGNDSTAGNSGTARGTASGSAVSYTVAKGDTLCRIARKHGVTLAKLLAWNPQIKNANLIFPGQIIKLGIEGQNIAIAAAASAPEGAVYDEVRKGDSLYRIAKRNGVALNLVMKLNPRIAKQKYIYPRQKIRVK